MTSSAALSPIKARRRSVALTTSSFVSCPSAHGLSRRSIDPCPHTSTSLSLPQRKREADKRAANGDPKRQKRPAPGQQAPAGARGEASRAAGTVKREPGAVAVKQEPAAVVKAGQPGQPQQERPLAEAPKVKQESAGSGASAPMAGVTQPAAAPAAAAFSVSAVKTEVKLEVSVEKIVQQPAPGNGSGSHAPYADTQGRPVKSLSPGCGNGGPGSGPHTPQHQVPAG